jgi:hypothetical protein
MFETLFKFLEFLLNALSKVPESRKRGMGRTLLAMYQELQLLITSGRDVLSALSEHNALDAKWREALAQAHRSGNYDPADRLEREVDLCVEHIRGLLIEQEKRVRHIMSTANRKSVKGVLSVRLPQLHPLLLAEVEAGKGKDLKVFLETLEAMKAYDREDGLRELIEEGELSGTQYPSGADFDYPILFDESDLSRAKRQLKKVSAVAERLRRFLAVEFSIADLA